MNRSATRIAIALLACLFFSADALAGTMYEVTSKKGDQTITYRVKFGGGKLMEKFTAFDPDTKKFVYLNFKRRGKAPKPASVIWDHNTGERIKLYQFPDAKHPLPVIPSIQAMKVCPMTGDKVYKSKAIMIYD